MAKARKKVKAAASASGPYPPTIEPPPIPDLDLDRRAKAEHSLPARAVILAMGALRTASDVSDLIRDEGTRQLVQARGPGWLALWFKRLDDLFLNLCATPEEDLEALMRVSKGHLISTWGPGFGGHPMLVAFDYVEAVLRGALASVHPDPDVDPGAVERGVMAIGLGGSLFARKLHLKILFPDESAMPLPFPEEACRSFVGRLIGPPLATRLEIQGLGRHLWSLLANARDIRPDRGATELPVAAVRRALGINYQTLKDALIRAGCDWKGSAEPKSFSVDLYRSAISRARPTLLPDLDAYLRETVLGYRTPQE